MPTFKSASPPTSLMHYESRKQSRKRDDTLKIISKPAAEDVQCCWKVSAKRRLARFGVALRITSSRRVSQRTCVRKPTPTFEAKHNGTRAFYSTSEKYESVALCACDTHTCTWYRNQRRFSDAGFVSVFGLRVSLASETDISPSGDKPSQVRKHF